MSLATLRARGILGMNRRNSVYIQGLNERSLYPTVDDKLETKARCEAAGIPVPKLLGCVRTHREARSLPEIARDHPSFVVKPARGAMGNGILVLSWQEGLLMRGDRVYPTEDLVYHAAGIVSGLYSLAGTEDVAMLEERLIIDPAFDALVADGVPDLRVIVYRGVPVMAMMRLPTRASGGRANLHQGAVGAGVDLETGRMGRAIQQDAPVAKSPDTGVTIEGFQIPHFDQIVEVALRATDETGLGYVGADVVVDANRGPVILELNARPGLAIQIANGHGLRPRLDGVDAWHAAADRTDASVDERIAAGRAVSRRDLV